MKIDYQYFHTINNTDNIAISFFLYNDNNDDTA